MEKETARRCRMQPPNMKLSRGKVYKGALDHHRSFFPSHADTCLQAQAANMTSTFSVFAERSSG